jgi:DNA-directed RNA polymerase subunit beta'
LLVRHGELVAQGQKLTADKFDPHKFFHEVGAPHFQEKLVEKVQAIYRQEGVVVHEKHIEIIARQMLGKVRITDAGDTKLSQGQEVDRSEFLEQNRWVISKGGQPAEAAPILLGITQVAKRTRSFLSAASFQNTNKILTEAAAMAKCDELQGIKECVMTGKIIPVGTGFQPHRNTEQSHQAG